MIRIPLAIAGGPALGHVDENGYVWLGDGSRVEWWVLGDDHWHVPAASASLRQYAVDNSPVVESSIRVPGGDVAWRVGAIVSASGPVIVVECENRASIPVAVGVARVDRDGFVTLDVHPVTHSNTWGGALDGRGATGLTDLGAVSRGWLALARQGAQVETNDPTIDDALLVARTSLLLHHGELVAQGKRADRETAAAVASALTMLDYEVEAGALRRAARLKPARKGLPIVGDVTVPPISVGNDNLAPLADPLLAARTVMAIRSILVRDDGGTTDCLPSFNPLWRGRSIDVSGLPTNDGTLAYAVRWHGDKPALLWEFKTDKRVTVTAHALDPTWSTSESSGEVLLATRPA